MPDRRTRVSIRPLLTRQERKTLDPEQKRALRVARQKERAEDSDINTWKEALVAFLAAIGGVVNEDAALVEAKRILQEQPELSRAELIQEVAVSLDRIVRWDGMFGSMLGGAIDQLDDAAFAAFAHVVLDAVLDEAL